MSVFRFVNERTELGQTPKRAELTEHWNEQQTDDKDMFWDRSALRRAYERVEKRLAYPWIRDPLGATEAANPADPDVPT